jgi:inorganic triphosphatase YgiF
MTAERPVEVELKYRVRDVAAGERFLAAETLGPFKATSGARTAQHEDRYLDTSDGALARAGFAARLRQTNGSTVVTVKAIRPPDGAMARREELEGPADRSADPSDWPPSAARSLILELCGDLPLVELVTVRQLRRKRKLKSADATAELSLDEVDVVARGRIIDRFVELEVELTSGTEERLIELGRVLAGDNGLAPALG